MIEKARLCLKLVRDWGGGGNALDARRRDEATQPKESLRSDNEADGVFPPAAARRVFRQSLVPLCRLAPGSRAGACGGAVIHCTAPICCSALSISSRALTLAASLAWSARGCGGADLHQRLHRLVALVVVGVVNRAISGATRRLMAGSASRLGWKAIPTRTGGRAGLGSISIGSIRSYCAWGST